MLTFDPIDGSKLYLFLNKPMTSSLELTSQLNLAKEKERFGVLKLSIGDGQISLRTNSVERFLDANDLAFLLEKVIEMSIRISPPEYTTLKREL